MLNIKRYFVGAACILMFVPLLSFSASRGPVTYLVTGKSLLPKCKAAAYLLNHPAKNSAQVLSQASYVVPAMYCLGFVSAAHDACSQFLHDAAINDLQYRNEMKKIPQAPGLLAEMFLKYLQNHTEELPYSAYQSFFVFIEDLLMQKQ